MTTHKNKFGYLLIIASFLSLQCSGADKTTKSGLKSDGYRLVWQDDFNGSTLNEKDNWNIEVNGDGGGNRELQFYRKENVSVGIEPESGENCLIITARKENFSGKNFTSGRINTHSKVEVKYGKIEAKIKLPKTENGLWPAFWLLGSDISKVGWPESGEIDILEMGNTDGIKSETQDRYYNGACHWGLKNQNWHPYLAKSSTNKYSLQGEFHLFTMIWDKDKIKMYLDQDKFPKSKPYFTLNLTQNKSENAPAKYFQKPFYILFNLAVGGNFTGILNLENITALKNDEAKMYVDYVRIYQKENTKAEFSQYVQN